MRNPNSTQSCPEYAGRNRALERELWKPSWRHLEDHRRSCASCRPTGFCSEASPLVDAYELACDAAAVVTAGSLHDRRVVLQDISLANRGRVEALAAQWRESVKDRLKQENK